MRQFISKYKMTDKLLQYLSLPIHARCQSPHHNKDSKTAIVWILAVPCDGRRECYDGVDEDGCQEDQNIGKQNNT